MENKKIKFNILKNKKADIGITILVLGIIALVAIALMSFISSEQKQNQSISSVVFLENMYKDVESFEFSGIEYLDKYNGIEKISKTIIDKNGKSKTINEGFVIKKTFKKETGIIWKDKKEIMKVKYEFGS